MMTEPYNSSADATPCYSNDRDLGHFSDHMTVWSDKYVGEEKPTKILKQNLMMIFKY
jgi:hypothetical protein